MLANADGEVTRGSGQNRYDSVRGCTGTKRKHTHGRTLMAESFPVEIGRTGSREKQPELRLGKPGNRPGLPGQSGKEDLLNDQIAS